MSNTKNVPSSDRKAVYIPKNFILHAASLHQAFAHCGRFSTAATRRCMARVSVPLVGVRLSPPLAVIALVSCYLTNKLIARRLISIRKLKRATFSHQRRHYRVLVLVSQGYARVNGMYLRVTTPSAGVPINRDPLTYMPYPRR